MKLILTLLLCGAIAAHAAPRATPQFQLSAGDSKGLLVWRSHTFVPDGDQLVPKEDYIVEDPKAGVISVCLEWKTEPDASTGEFLAAFGSWAIPMTILKKDAFILSVERDGSKSIVFTLSTLQGRLLLKSDAFPIARAWRGSLDDLEKHITPVPASVLEKKEPNKSAQTRPLTRPV